MNEQASFYPFSGWSPMTASIFSFLVSWIVIHDLNHSFWHLGKHLINNCRQIMFYFMKFMLQICPYSKFKWKQYYNIRKKRTKYSKDILFYSLSFSHFYTRYGMLLWLEQNGIKIFEKTESCNCRINLSHWKNKQEQSTSPLLRPHITAVLRVF